MNDGSLGHTSAGAVGQDGSRKRHRPGQSSTKQRKTRQEEEQGDENRGGCNANDPLHSLPGPLPSPPSSQTLSKNQTTLADTNQGSIPGTATPNPSALAQQRLVGAQPSDEAATSTFETPGLESGPTFSSNAVGFTPRFSPPASRFVLPTLGELSSSEGQQADLLTSRGVDPMLLPSPPSLRILVDAADISRTGYGTAGSNARLLGGSCSPLARHWILMGGDLAGTLQIPESIQCGSIQQEHGTPNRSSFLWKQTALRLDQECHGNQDVGLDCFIDCEGAA